MSNLPEAAPVELGQLSGLQRLRDIVSVARAGVAQAILIEEQRLKQLEQIAVVQGIRDING